MKTFRAMIFGALACISLVGCGGGGNSGGGTVTPVEPKMTVNSTIFSDGTELPLENKCKWLGGQNLSPMLYWKDAPKGTNSYMVFAELSGPSTATIWTVYNIPVTTTVIETGQDLSKVPGVVVGRNREGNQEYIGPCLTGYNQTYTFTVYALNDKAPVMTNEYVDILPVTREKLEKDYKDFIVGKASITTVIK